MSSYLFTWNPERWQWIDIESAISEISIKGYYSGRWSSGSTRKIVTGDRVFLMKLGKSKPRGVMASGWVASDVFQEVHWGDATKLANYNFIHFDTILNPAHEGIFPIELLLGSEKYSRMHWTPQASGTQIPDDIAEQLERDWAQFLGRGVPVLEILYPDEISGDLIFLEGLQEKISVNKYERNPEARAICIQRYGAVCFVCGLDFCKMYGDIGKGFIHVHHLRPLSINGQYELNPISDLRPVCPNCHAMLHKKNPEPYTIEEMKDILNANKS